jgi:flagellar hook-length control protein FliK
MIVASFLSQILGLAQSPAEVDGAVGETLRSDEFGDLLATSLAATGNSIAAGAPEILNSAAIPESGEQENEPSLGDNDDKKSAVDVAHGLMLVSPLWFQAAPPGPQPVASQSAEELSFESGDGKPSVKVSATTIPAQLDSASSESPKGLPVIQNGADSAQPLTMAEPVETALTKNSHSDLLSGMADALADDATGAPTGSIVAPEANQTQPSTVKSAADTSVKPETLTGASEVGGKNVSTQEPAKNQHAGMAEPIAAAPLTAPAPVTTTIASGLTNAIDTRLDKGRRSDFSRATESEKEIESSDPADVVSIDALEPAANNQSPLRQMMSVEHEGIAPVGERNNQNSSTNTGGQSEAFERPIAATFHLSSTSVLSENSKDGWISTVPWQPVVERVAGEIVGHLRIGKQEAVIQLDPPELGKIRIDLRIDGDKIEARISAVEHSARALLENHLTELRHALEVGQVRSADVNIDSLSWSGASGSGGSQGSQEAFQRGGQQGSGQSGSLLGTLSDAVTPARSDRPGDGQNRISMWA